MSKLGKVNPGRFDFISVSKYLFTLSIVTILGALVYILAFDGNDGAELSGGTEVQITIDKELETSKILNFMGEMGYRDASIQSLGRVDEFLIRREALKAPTEKDSNMLLQETIKKVTEGLSTAFKDDQPSVQRVDTVGPQVGSELKRNGILAAFYAMLMILIYIGLRFDYKYAPGAVFCLVHDSIVICGLYAVFRFEMNVQTMAAILTIIGYSMNDTIVVFDRIRENEKLFRDQTFTWICNRSMNDVLSRTILTSLTTFISVSIMWALAGGVIKDFAMTMAIGIIIGTYSTMYVAAPLVIWYDRLEKSKTSGR